MGRSGDVSSLIRVPLPPRLVLHAANVLRATEIHTWGRNAATIRWLPPEGGAIWVTVEHFKDRDLRTTTRCPGWATFRGPCSSCSPRTLQPRYAGSRRAAKG